MPLPVNVDTCTVTGVYVKLDGTPAAGTVTFTPVPARLLDAGADPPTTILGTPIVATLDENGALDVDLPATDDDDLNPVDWAYHVSVRLGADTAYSFCMEAPVGTVDLTEVTPIIGTEGDAITTGPAGPQGETGVGVPTGGDTGYILVKASAVDYDMTWATSPPPGPHAASHAAAGIDPVTVEQSQVTGLVAGLAAKQPLDSDLTTIAALAPGSDAVIQRKVGMWVASTPTEYKTDLALTKSDVGLGNVTNTSDAAKPVSTAQQTALDLKADKSTTITPTAPLTGGGSLAANRTLDISTFTTWVKGAVPPPTTATGRFLKDDGTWDTPATGTTFTTEDAVDAVATALTEGAGIDITYNDVANTITVAATGGVADVVHVGTAAPSDATIELWWDTDEAAVDHAAALAAHEADTTAVHGIADTSLLALKTRTINTYSGTSLTAVIGDAGAYIRCTGTNPTYTIPLNSVVAFPTGTQIDGVGTATAMTLAATGGVTVNKARTLVTVAADSGWTAIKVATDEWDVHGDFV